MDEETIADFEKRFPELIDRYSRASLEEIERELIGLLKRRKDLNVRIEEISFLFFYRRVKAGIREKYYLEDDQLT